jgi:hypothetical protein
MIIQHQRHLLLQNLRFDAGAGAIRPHVLADACPFERENYARESSHIFSDYF